VTMIKHCFKLLMPIYSLQLSPINFTINLHKFTERSATY